MLSRLHGCLPIFAAQRMLKDKFDSRLPEGLIQVNIRLLQRDYRERILQNRSLRSLRVKYANFSTVHIPNLLFALGGAALAATSILLGPIGFLAVGLGAGAVVGSAFTGPRSVHVHLPTRQVTDIDLSLEDILNLQEVKDDDAIFIDPQPLVDARIIERTPSGWSGRI